MEINEAKIREIVEQVVKSVGAAAPAQSTAPKASEGVSPGPTSLGDGVFATIDEAIAATAAAQKAYIQLPLCKRKEIVQAVRCVARDNAEIFARETVAETGMGRVSDKIVKHQLVADLTPGFEDMETRAWSGDGGLTIEEMAPFGVVGAVTPSTHPAPTMLHNTICNLVAGNGVVFNAHPGGKRVFAHAHAGHDARHRRRRRARPTSSRVWPSRPSSRRRRSSRTRRWTCCSSPVVPAS